MNINNFFKNFLKMSNFPLYTSLNNNIADKDLTVLQKNEFVKKVSKLDSETHELIYALIKSFWLEENKNSNSFNLPYEGKVCKDKIEFDLLDFPFKLRQILYKFINIHKKKILEDERIKNNQG
jgi:hypothetical protein